MTSNFLNNTCTKIQNMAFKTSKMDQIALEYWYNSFLRHLRVDGRRFFHEKQSWKKVLQTRHQDAAHAQKRVTVLIQPWESNPRPPALPSSALPTELILPRQLTSSSWHYSGPLSVYCWSIVFLVVVKLSEIYRFIMKIPNNRWDENRKRRVPCTDSVWFTQFWSKQSQFQE